MPNYWYRDIITGPLKFIYCILTPLFITPTGCDAQTLGNTLSDEPPSMHSGRGPSAMWFSCGICIHTHIMWLMMISVLWNMCNSTRGKPLMLSSQYLTGTSDLPIFRLQFNAFLTVWLDFNARNMFFAVIQTPHWCHRSLLNVKLPSSWFEPKLSCKDHHIAWSSRINCSHTRNP